MTKYRGIMSPYNSYDVIKRKNTGLKNHKIDVDKLSCFLEANFHVLTLTKLIKSSVRFNIT